MAKENYNSDLYRTGDTSKYLKNFLYGDKFHLKSGDILEVKKADIPVKLIQAPGKNYYQLLRKKLHWGGTAENNL